jgi:thiamine-phosphate pyrophosphorylase
VIIEVVSAGLLGHGAGLAIERARLAAQARQAALGGADFFQVREPGLAAGVLCAVVRDVLAATKDFGMRVVVNDRVDVAIAAGAHGVHLKEESVVGATVRRFVRREFVIGVSVHDADGARRAGRDADYLLAGTVWPTTGKAAGHRTLGAEGLAAIVEAAAAPVLAIGGVTLERFPTVAAAGAGGAAAIGLFALAGPPEQWAAEIVRQRVAALRRLSDSAGSVPDICLHEQDHGTEADR